MYLIWLVLCCAPAFYRAAFTTDMLTLPDLAFLFIGFVIAVDIFEKNFKKKKENLNGNGR